MPHEDHQATATQPKSPKALRGILIILAILTTGLLFTTLALRDDEGTTGRPADDALSPPPSLQSTTTVGPEDELVLRLKQILADREAAYRKRDPEILKTIYTVDCPCLESDSNAIRELIREDYVWVGGETSIRVRRSERVNERMWIIIADFTSEPLRIQTESGPTVRSEPRGSDPFQFVLAKPSGSSQWLLGRATSFVGG